MYINIFVCVFLETGIEDCLSWL